MRRFLLLSLISLLAVPAVAQAAAPVEPAPFVLSVQNKADLSKVEAYFNTLPPLQARFTQTAELPDGSAGTLQGDFKLWRPGRLAIRYDAPNRDFIIADGHVIHQWDGQMEQASQMQIKDSLAGFILQQNISFNGDNVTVTEVNHPTPTTLDVSVRSVKEPESGSLTLHFTTVPMALTGWTVIDAQNLSTHVAFDHMESGVTFSKDQFIFRKPRA